MTTKVSKTKFEVGDSLNAYDSVQCLVASTPEGLCEMISSIRKPIKIISITAMNNRHICYFTGSFKIRKGR